MRKTIDARKALKKADTRRIDGYHQRDFEANNYAQCGWKNRCYYASDRKQILEDVRGNWLRPQNKRGVRPPMEGYALEIETVNDSIDRQSVHDAVIRTMALNVFEPDMFKLQHDGSLGGKTSGECITQVMSREYIRNNYARFKRFWDESLPAIGSTADHITCGMHTNISMACFGETQNAQVEAIKKLTYFVNANYRLMCILMKRNPSRTGYASYMDDWTNLDFVRGHNGEPDWSNTGHNVSCNWAHIYESPATARFELRLPGGQANYITFRNTMEVIFHLVQAVKSLSWSAMQSVEKVFAKCNKYVLQRLHDAVGLELTTDQYETIKATHDATTNYEVTLA